MYHGEMNEKIKLLFRLHIPPALMETDGDSESPLKNPLMSTTRPLMMAKSNGDGVDYQKQLKQMLRDIAKEQDTKIEKELPKMTQREFIQLCKTLYSLFHEAPEENELYQAIATVTTLLLQIGEVGQKSSSSASVSDKGPSVALSSEGTDCVEQDIVFLDTVKTPRSSSSPALPVPQCDWKVSFEHILASLLTEQSLVNFFERTPDLKPKLESAKVNHYGLKPNGVSLQT